MPNRFLFTPFFLDKPAAELRALAGRDWRLNVPGLEGLDLATRLGSLHRPLADFVSGAIHDRTRPVSVCGDCCQTIPVLAGLRRRGIDPILLWLDAHGDFNTPATTPSGFIGGMPLAMIVGRGEQTLLRQVGLEPLPERNVILSDARDLDPGERVSLRKSAVTHLTRIEDVASRLPAGRPVYVHLDVDVIDSREAPAMLYPVAGGPSLTTLLGLAADLRQRRQVVAISMTPWAIAKDADGRTRDACWKLFEALCAT